VKTLGIQPARQSNAYARTEFGTPPTADVETYARTPSQQVNDLPFDILGPIRKK